MAVHDALVDLLDEIIDLALGGLDDHLRVNQAGGAHHLLDDLVGLGQLEGPGRGRQEQHLAHPFHELLETQRTVVGRRRQAEAELDQVLLAAVVAFILAVELGHRLMRFVEHHQKIVGEEVDQRAGWLAGRSTLDRRAVVLDAVAIANFLHHLEVVLRAHSQSLRLEQLALFLEGGETLLEFGFDAGDGLGHAFRVGDVVGRGEHHQLVEVGHLLTRERIDDADGLDLVAEQLDADRRLVVGGMDLDGVAPDPELAPHQVHVVSLVTHVDQGPQDRPLVMFLAATHGQHLRPVLLG